MEKGTLRPQSFSELPELAPRERGDSHLSRFILLARERRWASGAALCGPVWL